eukprot:Opistho-2@13440
MQDALDDLVDVVGHFGRARLDREVCGARSRTEAELQEHPEAVGELDRLVEEISAINVPLGDGENVVGKEARFNAIRSGLLDSVDGKAALVGLGDLLPRRHERIPLNLAVLGEENVDGHHRRKVKHVNVVADRNLECRNGLHLLHGAVEGEGQRRVTRLVGGQERELECTTGGHGKAVLVELDGKVVHRLHRLVREGHIHVQLPLATRKCSRNLQSLALCGRQPHRLGGHVGVCRGHGTADPKQISKAAGGSSTRDATERAGLGTDTKAESRRSRRRTALGRDRGNVAEEVERVQRLHGCGRLRGHAVAAISTERLLLLLMLLDGRGGGRTKAHNVKIKKVVGAALCGGAGIRTAGSSATSTAESEGLEGGGGLGGARLGLVLVVALCSCRALECRAAAGSLSLDKGGRGLVVDGGQGGDLPNELVQERPLEHVRLICNERLLREHDRLCRGRVRGEEAPVNVATVAEVGIVRLLRSQLQHLLHKLLRVAGALEEELDNRGEKLQLDLGVFVLEVVEEGREELVSVLNALRILSNDPDDRSLGLGLVQSVEVFAESSNDRLVAVGVLAENVLDHDNGLLHNIVDLRLDELEERLDATLSGALNLDGAASNGTDRLAHEVHINLRGILLELGKDLRNVVVGGEADHNVKLLQLDVDGVIVLDKEHLRLLAQDLGALLHNDANVAECNILDLRLGREEGNERGSELLGHRGNKCSIVNHLQVLHQNLHGAEDDGSVCVRQTGAHTFADALGLTRVRGDVLRQRVEDEDLTPLCAFVEGGEELVQSRLVDQEDLLATRGRRLVDLRERCNRIGNNHGVRVREKVAELVKEALCAREAWINVVQLGDADGGSLAHIRILILEALAEGVAEVLCDLVDTDAAHRADGKRADEGIWVHAVLDERVDGKNGKVRLALGVVHQVQVYKLLELQIIRLHAVDDIGEE